MENIKAQIYYVRNGNHPFATVAVAKTSDGKVVRGVAICSDNDQFQKKVGTATAMGRLKQALAKKSTSDKMIGTRSDGSSPKSDVACEFYCQTNGQIKFLFEYDAKPTEAELSILKNKGE